MKRYRCFIFSLVIFSITALVFSRLTVCDFSWWDDQETIHQNPRLNPPTLSTLHYYWTYADEHDTMGLYVPVTYTFWSGLALIAHRDHPDLQGLRLNGWVFHTANVFLHAIAAVIVFQLLLALFCNDTAAACGALLFALHPVQVESVGWISGAKDLLCGLLSCAALLMYVHSVQQKRDRPLQRWPARWRYWLGTLLFVLAMLSKPTAVVVPLMACVISLFLQKQPKRKTFFSLLPWLLLMIPCLIWTQKVQPASWEQMLPAWARPMVALDALAFYFCKLVWPIHLGIDYGHRPEAIVANHLIYYSWIAPVSVALVLGWRYRKHYPAVAAALLFLLPLLPVSGLVPFEFQLVSTTADHYLYLPMVGVGMLLTLTLIEFKIPKWGVIILLIALASRSVLQEPVWQNSRTLFLHSLSVNPRSVKSMDNLAYLAGRDARRLADAGRHDDAKPLFAESIQWYRRSLDCEPNSVPSMVNLALNYKTVGRMDLGLEQIHRIINAQPQLPAGLKAEPLSLAHLLIDFGDTVGAITYLDEVLKQDPSNLQAAVLRERAIQHLAR